MWIHYISLLYIIQIVCYNHVAAQRRQRRYLIFTPNTQWGVFATVAVPLPAPEGLVSVAWFFEANYYNVANASYLDPLLGDVELYKVELISMTLLVYAVDLKNYELPVYFSLDQVQFPSLRTQRSISDELSRRTLYTFVENMLIRHGYPGRECLLRAICESASQYLHNGVLGDLLHLLLTPSTSISEDDVEDSYYEAEYWGLEKQCDYYNYDCPSNPIDNISIDLK